jgi:hypothetical protein
LKPSDLFFIVFLATILVTRIALYIRPTASPTIDGFRLHHYMYGIVIAIIGVLCKNIVVFSIGLGLLIDEIPYLIIHGKTHKDNYSEKSLAGVLILTLIVLLARNFLIKIVLR